MYGEGVLLVLDLAAEFERSSKINYGLAMAKSKDVDVNR
jgi:hypothetical protein